MLNNNTFWCGCCSIFHLYLISLDALDLWGGGSAVRRRCPGSSLRRQQWGAGGARVLARAQDVSHIVVAEAHRFTQRRVAPSVTRTTALESTFRSITRPSKGGLTCLWVPGSLCTHPGGSARPPRVLWAAETSGIRSNGGLWRSMSWFKRRLRCFTFSGGNMEGCSGVIVPLLHVHGGQREPARADLQ